jgi:hypothetical protein
MKRFAVFALFQCLGIMAFCQPAATAPGTAQAAPGKPSAPQPRFTFSSSPFGQISPSTQSGGSDSCPSQSATPSPMGAQRSVNPFFHVPCMNLQSLSEMARVNPPVFVPPASPLPPRRWPNARSGPLPTQWPNLKFERIPTTWPDLQMMLVTEQKAGPAPAK